VKLDGLDWFGGPKGRPYSSPGRSPGFGRNKINAACRAAISGHPLNHGRYRGPTGLGSGSATRPGALPQYACSVASIRSSTVADATAWVRSICQPGLERPGYRSSAATRRNRLQSGGLQASRQRLQDL